MLFFTVGDNIVEKDSNVKDREKEKMFFFSKHVSDIETHLAHVLL